ncbi:MAG: hypothetical protein H7126_14610 [Candidatus Parcubacteria bacterium]|uniref:hypothetical protein n=1 Tax=Phormidesmis priestleyi TaxID=268141 RepID=UPI00083A755A|nr:hypothetical protein [Phormidesmis priestleyi]MBC7825069.1 hypothetical protein [Leptolyngbyaceae cyanobacterium LF-bin-113]
MPRNSNDLSPTEKVKVALDCLHRELLGDSNASKTVAKKYDLSTRGVTTLRNLALDILQKGFSPSMTPAPSVTAALNDKTLDRNLDSLLNSSTSIGDSQLEASESEADDTDEIAIDEVVAAIIDYNKSKKEPPVYISQGILQKISGQSVAEVKSWFADHEQEVNKHNAKYDLTPVTNRRVKRNFNYRQELGLDDSE